MIKLHRDVWKKTTARVFTRQKIHVLLHKLTYCDKTVTVTWEKSGNTSSNIMRKWL